MEDNQEKIIDKISNIATSRLKIPIISTYIAVLILYNWDIIYYLFYENGSASSKISFIKCNYHDEYYFRIFQCLIIAISILIIFTILNTFLSLLLKWFYKKDKEVKEEINSHEKIKQLTEQLAISLEELNKVNEENKKLNVINDNLSNNPLKKYSLEKSEIAKKELNDIINNLRTMANGDKNIYSLKEFISMVKENPKIHPNLIIDKSTYENDMKTVINYLEGRGLITKFPISSFENKNPYFKLNTSFTEILNLE